MTTRIIIRGAAEIEIILPAGVEPPTVGIPASVSAGEASTGTVRSCTAPSPGSPKQSCGGVEGHAAPAAGLIGDSDSVMAEGAEPMRQLDQRHGATASAVPAGIEPRPHDALPTVLDEPTVAALMAKVGDQVREAVANPPPPVEPPDELALTRPVGDGLDLPAFLDRRPVRSHG